MKWTNQKNYTGHFIANWLPIGIARPLDRVMVKIPDLLWRQGKLAMVIDIWYGIVSGIPSCCILHYARNSNNPLKTKEWKKYLRKQKHKDGITYVQCPKCYRN